LPKDAGINDDTIKKENIIKIKYNNWFSKQIKNEKVA